MANNIWSNYTEKTATPVDADEVMVRDSTDGKNKRLLFGTFWKWVAKKLNEATISELQTSNKTIIGAINALNSESQTLDFIECRIKTVSGFLKITKETIIKGNAPTSSNYIPVVAGHSNSNDVSENVFYDSSSWYIRSNVAQEITIRFYKTAK